MTTTTGPAPHPGRTALWLAAIAGALVLLHVVAMQVNFNEELGLKERLGLHYWQVSVFDLDEEESFGTWLSVVMLLYAGRLLLALARDRRAAGAPWHRHWFALAVGFHILSIDEVVAMHEYLNTTLESVPWTVVGGAGTLLVGLVYVPFLWGHRGRTAGLFLAAGVLYVGGALGVEHWTGSDVNSLGYNMWTTLEEGMEMAGVILFIYALLDHGRRLRQSVSATLGVS